MEVTKVWGGDILGRLWVVGCGSGGLGVCVGVWFCVDVWFCVCGVGCWVKNNQIVGMG